MADEDELLDLVDENDQVVATIMRSETKEMAENRFLRAAEAFIVRSDGKLWIPRRQPHKRIAPNGLDYSMGEHVASGEDYLPAAIRGFKEELNIELKAEDLKLLNKFPPASTHYFRSVYLYHSDKVPKYNPEDFSEYLWLSPEELITKLKNGEPAKDSLLETVEFLIAQKSS